jgi:hypothetical protein
LIASEHVLAGDEAAFVDGAAEVGAIAQVDRVQQGHGGTGDVAVQLNQAEIDEALVAVEDIRQQRRALGGIAHQVGHAGQVDQDLARALERLGLVGGGHAGEAAQVLLGRLDGMFALAYARQDRHHRQRHDRQRHQQHQAAAQTVQPKSALTTAQPECHYYLFTAV